MGEARLESERVVRQGMETRDALRRDMEREINSRAVERACELIQRALPLGLREDLQKRWFDELFRDGLAQQFDRLKTDEAVRDLKEVKITSALPLTKEQQTALRAQLKQRLGREVAVIEEIDERLVAGLMLIIGNLVFDGSLASRIQDAMRKANDASS